MGTVAPGLLLDSGPKEGDFPFTADSCPHALGPGLGVLAGQAAYSVPDSVPVTGLAHRSGHSGVEIEAEPRRREAGLAPAGKEGGPWGTPVLSDWSHIGPEDRRVQEGGLLPPPP